MYKVLLTKKCSSELLILKKSGKITNKELIIIRTWINEMTLLGPDYIASSGHWNDHELKDNRSGQRSSSFSSSGRIIYKVKKSKIEISVIKITADHNYE